LLIYGYTANLYPNEKVTPAKLGMPYQRLGLIGMVLVSLILFLAPTTLLNARGNNGTGFLLSFFLSLAFLFMLAIQTVISAITGDFSSIIATHGDDPFSVVHTMDFVGGALMGVFGLAAILAFLPIAEAYTYYEDTHFSTGRSMRMLFAALFALAALWTSLSPIKALNAEKALDAETAKQWDTLHTRLVIITFGFMWLYLFTVTADRCSPFEGRSCGSVNFLGLSMATMGGVMMLVSKVLTVSAISENAETNMFFCIGEMIVVLSLPVTLLSRYTSRDFVAMKDALIQWQAKSSGFVAV